MSNETTGAISAHRGGATFIWIGRVLTGLAAAFFVMDGTMKLIQPQFVIDATRGIGWPTDPATHLHDRIILFDDQSRRLSGFGGRVGALRLPVDLEQISATLGPLALREHFLNFLFRIVLYWHLDLARRHSPLLFGHVLGGISRM